MQPFAEIRAVEARAIGQSRHRCPVLRDQLHIHFRHIADPPRRAFLIGVEAAQILLDRHAEDVGDRLAAGGDANRADQGQARQPCRIAHCQLGGDPAAERGADQMHPFQIQCLQQIEIEIGEIGNVIEPGRVVRLTKAGMLWSKHREALRQLFEKPHPASVPASAVQENDGRSRSAAQQPDRRPVHRDHFRAVRHCGSPPTEMSSP